MQTGTNSPEPALYEGQVSVFKSPHAGAVLLVDVAYKDKYGHIRWAAVPHDSSLYAESIQHHARIQSLEKKLRSMLNALLAKAEGLLPKDRLAPLQSGGHLIALHRLLRVLASEFGQVGLSHVYWPVIDAIGFFEDATTDAWPYTTLALRHQYLEWAEQLTDDQSAMTLH